MAREIENLAKSFMSGELTRRQMLTDLWLSAVTVLCFCLIAACSSTNAPKVSPSANLKAMITVAVSSFNNESTAIWQGSGGMFPYITPMYDPLIRSNLPVSLQRTG